MRKSFILAACAALFGMSFISCTNNDEEMTGASQGVKEAISFNTPITRGTPIAEDGETAMGNFKVWGYYGSTVTATGATANAIYMGGDASTGVTVTYADSKWGYSPLAYWPGDALNFVACGPIDATEITAYAASSAEGTASLTATVAIPADVNNQKDIMMGAATASSGTAGLAFKHALSQIQFKAKLASADITSAVVNSIQIVNVKGAGTVTYTSAGTPSAAATGSANASYTLATNVANDELVDQSTPIVTSAESAVMLSATDGKLMLMPQAITAWDGEAFDGEGVPTSGAYIKVNLTIVAHGTTIFDGDAYAPLGTTWAQGKIYTYTLICGQSVLSPIQFSVSSTDWAAADPANEDKNF